MKRNLCFVFILLLILGLFWLMHHHGSVDTFTLPFAGGRAYDPGYGGIADKEVVADSLMT